MTPTAHAICFIPVLDMANHAHDGTYDSSVWRPTQARTVVGYKYSLRYRNANPFKAAS